MVRPLWSRSLVPLGRPVRHLRRAAARIVIPGLFFLCGGCALAPRSQLDECQQLSRTLRSENARLKDQLLTAENQNQDYADRAMDDSLRLTRQDAAIERLEQSVQAYQDERARLESAYRKLTASLGGAGTRDEERLSQTDPVGTPKNKARIAAPARGAKDREDVDRVESKP